MKVRRFRLLLGLSVLVVLCSAIAWPLYPEQSSAALRYLITKLRGGYTVEERLALHSAAVGSRLRITFESAGVPYPPVELAYVAIKDARRLEVHSRASADSPWTFVTAYRVLGQSGGPGPKLKDGDSQVPEGLYRAEFLNPNSRFHLSVRLNYPNDFDRMMAEVDGRAELGTDIMIHGSSASIGCLAVGDTAAEDLFILAALATKESVRIIISPTDFRVPGASAPDVPVAWAGELYAALQAELSKYPREVKRT